MLKIVMNMSFGNNFNMQTNDILVLTPTLGNRDSIRYTIQSVKDVGGDRVRHVIIAPANKVENLKKLYPETECIAEPKGTKSIYAALNYGFNQFGKNYKYLTFINDDDYWLPDYVDLIDTAYKKNIDVLYARTQFVNKFRVKIDSQTCSSQFKDFISLLRSGIILITQQAVLVRSELFFRLGGFDETYSLVADTKFWALASRLTTNYLYINKEVAAYTINKGNQLSSDHSLQRKEHFKLLEDLNIENKNIKKMAVIRFRFTNMSTYIKRAFKLRGYRKKPIQGKFIQGLTMMLPWKIRRYVLNKYFLYDIAPTAHIGFSFIYPRFLRMKEGASIGHFNVAIHLDCIEMGKNCIIGRSNWITGFPTGTDSPHFAHDHTRSSQLIMGDESSITKKHHIDCTNMVKLGNFASIGGYNTQILTHSVDMYECRQDSKPIIIGKYSLVATRSIITGGAILPAYSVLCAGAYLGKQYDKEWTMYAGVPARPVKEIPKSAKRFSRTSGYIY